MHDQIKLTDFTISETRELFGPNDKNIKRIMKKLGIEIYSTMDSEIVVQGGEEQTEIAIKVLHDLVKLIRKGESLTSQAIDYSISLIQGGKEIDVSQLGDDCICKTYTGKPIKPKTFHQKEVAASINENTITLCLGGAGTGKSYISVAMACKYLKEEQIEKIILCKPTVESGQSIGYLPGDENEKLSPYMKSLYDICQEILGIEKFKHFIDIGKIESTSLNFLRGRTLKNCILIMDEAQNIEPMQAKLLLTRIGDNSKIIFTADESQCDLTHGQKSGLQDIIKVLTIIKEDVKIIKFDTTDVIRHSIVQKIIEAYDYLENNNWKLNME